VALASCFLAGLSSGSTAEIDRLSDHETATAQASTIVAVVNTDTGVNLDGVRTNYSAAIIDTLDDDFVLVSPAMADSGLENGTYGATITFSADVSAKVLSFNAKRPEKVHIEYTINPNLSDQDYLDLYMKIVNLEMSINTTLAGTYVSSIFAEVHAAQDHIDQVLNNDQSDLAALENVTLADFTASTDWDAIPEVQLQPTQADTSSFYASVDGFAQTVSTLYVDSYTAASTTYADMRTGLYGLIDELPTQEASWLNDVTNWSDDTLDYGGELAAYDATIRADQRLLDAWYADLATWHSDITTYQTNVAAWYQHLQTWFGQAQTWHTSYQDYLTTARSHTNQVATYQTSLTGAVTPVQAGLDGWRTELETYSNTLSGAHTTLTEAHTQYTTQLGQVTTYNTDLQTWHSGLTDYHTNLTGWVTELQTQQTQLQTTIEDINQLRTSIAALPPMPNAADFDGDTAGYDAAMQTWRDALTTFATTIPTIDEPPAVPAAPDAPTDFTGTAPPQLDPVSWTDPETPLPYAGPSLPDLALTFPEPDATLPTIDDLATPTPNPTPTTPTAIDPITITPAVAPQAPVIDPPPLPEDSRASIDSLRSQLDSFDINAYLDDDTKSEVAGLLADYQTDLTLLRDDLSAQFDSNVMQLLNAQSVYATYLSTLRSQALATETTEQDKLQTALQAYTQTKTDNSTDNQQRLGMFADLMPETRTVTGVNQTLVDFTVTPIQFTAPDQKPDTKPVTTQPYTQTYQTYLWIAIGILAILLAATAASYICTIHKHRRTTPTKKHAPLAETNPTEYDTNNE
jgi:uncharacterized phage infection (PIP) family protein YhgE